MRNFFKPDANTPACTCADWGMMYCTSTCAREIYIQKQQAILDKLREYEHVRLNEASRSDLNEDHTDQVDSNGAVHCVVSGDDPEDGRPFIVGEGLTPTRSDIPASGTSPTDSKQLGWSHDPGKSITETGIFLEPGQEFHDGILCVLDEAAIRGTSKPGDIFSGGKLVGHQVNGETISIDGKPFSVKGTLTGREPNVQNIPRAGLKELFSKYIRDTPANFKATAYNTLLSLTTKDLEFGVKEDRVTGRTVTDEGSTLVDDLIAVCREYLDTLGTHRQEAFIASFASPDSVEFFRRITQPNFHIGRRKTHESIGSGNSKADCSRDVLSGIERRVVAKITAELKAKYGSDGFVLHSSGPSTVSGSVAGDVPGVHHTETPPVESHLRPGVEGNS